MATIPKIQGESSLTWGGVTYWPVTTWRISNGIQTGSGDSWLAAAVRFLMGEDSTDTQSHIIAQYAAYTRTGAVDRNNGFFLIRRIGSAITTYTGTASAQGDFWTTRNSNQRQGYVYNAVLSGNFLWYDTPYMLADLGTQDNGSEVSAPVFYVGTSEVISGTYQQTSIEATYTIPVAPAAPSAVTNTRVSDNQNNVAVTIPQTTYTRLRLQRLTDGSTVSGEWTFAGAVTYADTGTTAAHSYKYRARLELVTEAGEAYVYASSWTESGTTYNTPAAPTAISGARLTGTTVRLTLTNTASTSTGLEVQASTSASDWASALSNTYSGAGLTTADFSGLGGSYYFRARNTRGSLASAWSPVSAAVVTITPPAAPSLTYPTGAVWNIATPSVPFRWQHNPLDGSSQTAAELQVSKDGGSTWTTYTATTAQTYSVAFTASDVGKTITWRVRTKGADSNWGPYSAAKAFTIAQAPSIVISLQDAGGQSIGGTLRDMPLRYVLTVNDASGTPAAVTVTVGGYSEDVDLTTLAGEITAAEFLPENGTQYTFTATVQSTSTLSAGGAVSFVTDFVLPQAGTLAVADSEGIETLTVGLAPAEGDETAAQSISVYRRYNGELVLLASDLAEGATVTDLYAPLNVDYEYIVATFSSAGIAHQVAFPQHVACSKWLVLWNGKQASAIWNPAGDIALKRPQKTLVQYIGRTYPVAYDGTALADERTMSWVLISAAERDAFVQLMKDGGQGIYKSGDGDVFAAVFEMTLKPEYTVAAEYGEITLKITRVESGAL